MKINSKNQEPNSNIPFLDLKAQYRTIKDEISQAIAAVLERGHFVLGEQVEAFEHDFAAYCGARYGVAVNSGTSALHLALLALGVGPGDEVITVPFTFVATVAAIDYTGARTIFVDIDPTSYTLAADQLERVISRHRRRLPSPRRRVSGEASRKFGRFGLLQHLSRKEFGSVWGRLHRRHEL